MKTAGRLLALAVGLGILLSVPGALLAADDAGNSMAKAKGFSVKVLKGTIEKKGDVDWWKPKVPTAKQWELYKAGGALLKSGYKIDIYSPGGLWLSSTTVPAALWLVKPIGANDFRLKITPTKSGSIGKYVLYFREVPGQ